MDRNEKISLFKLIGFSEQKCDETLKNEALSNELIDLIVKVKTDFIDFFFIFLIFYF